MVNICNGIVWPRNVYGPIKRKGLKKMISRVRKEVEQEFGGRDDNLGTFTGQRFADDDSVIGRLESSSQETISHLGWKSAIRNALIDCMKTDYYYAFEKEY